MDLGAFAGVARGVADRAESSLAMEACTEGAKDYLAVMRTVTPKRTGALADSETVTGPSGGGAVATAEVGPHIIYAEFRDRGGTINSKGPWSLSDGTSYFGRHVTQAGSHYMAKAEAAGHSVVEQACRVAVERFITF